LKSRQRRQRSKGKRRLTRQKSRGKSQLDDLEHIFPQESCFVEK
jgi:hypothetical protein